MTIISNLISAAYKFSKAGYIYASAYIKYGK